MGERPTFAEGPGRSGEAIRPTRQRVPIGMPVPAGRTPVRASIMTSATSGEEQLTTDANCPPFEPPRASRKRSPP